MHPKCFDRLVRTVPAHRTHCPVCVQPYTVRMRATCAPRGVCTLVGAFAANLVLQAAMLWILVYAGLSLEHGRAMGTLAIVLWSRSCIALQIFCTTLHTTLLRRALVVMVEPVPPLAGAVVQSV